MEINKMCFIIHSETKNIYYRINVTWFHVDFMTTDKSFSKLQKSIFKNKL